MTLLLSLLENAGVSMLLWGANIAAFAAVLRLTGRFWQRNAAPALRRAGYCAAVYLSIYWLPEIASSLRALLGLCFPGVFPETMGVPMSLPAAGRSAIPALRAFNWAAALGAAWLLGALACAAIRIVPRLRFRKWLRQNRRPLGRRAARILQKVMAQMDEAEKLRPGELLDESPRPLPAHPHPRCAAYTVPGLPGPMCVMSGNMRCLLLDKEDYDRETLEAIFRHELSHLAPGGARLWGYEDVLAVGGWWNPAAWLLRRCLREENELSCDALANRGRSAETRAAYARALTELAARRPAFLPGTAQMACGNRGLLRRRVRAVMQPPPRRRSIAVGLLFLLVALLSASVFFPAQTDGGARGMAVTEQTFLSYLRAPVDWRGTRTILPAGLYGAEEAGFNGYVREGATVAGLRLFYADAEALADGQTRLAIALTERLGAPVKAEESETVWQAADESGARTEVRLARGDGFTLVIE